MPLYNLSLDGVESFYARRPGAKQLVRREPLSGIADGTNVTFLTSHPSFLVASLKVHVGATVLQGTGLAEIDPDGGVIVFKTPPASQPLADYTAVPLTVEQVVLYAWAGFELMESLYSRGYSLSSDDAYFAMASYDSSDQFVVDAVRHTGDPVVDPVCGQLTFSTSPTQRALLARCIELAYLDASLYESSLSDVDFAERLGGARVNALGRPKNLAAARQVAWDEVRNALYAAMDESDPEGHHYGDQTFPPHTQEYEQIWHWQTSAGKMLPLTLTRSGM